MGPSTAARARTYGFHLVLAFLVIGGGSARSHAASDESTEHPIALKVYFLEELAKKDPGLPVMGVYPLLLGEISASLEKNPDESVLTELADRLLVDWGHGLVKAGDLGGAEEKYLRIEPGSPHRPAAARGLAGIYEKRADDLGDAESARGDATALYQKAEGFYLEIRDGKARSRVHGKWIDLKARTGIDHFDAGRLDEAWAELTAIDEEEGGLTEGRAAECLKDLRENTGEIVFERRSVEISGTAVAGNAEIRLVGSGAGRSWSGPYRDRLRRRTGAYTMTLTLAGAPEPVLTREVRISVGGAAPVSVPEKVPEGMVFIRAAPEAGVPNPFFMDRFEVTEKEYLGTGSDRLPARGITIVQARAYAQKVGKQLPTRAQWLWAAFEGKNQPYPWPGTDATGRCNVGTGRPTPVGSFPNGKSPFGVYDMVGNVWEWLRDGYALGGGFRNRATLQAYSRYGWNPARDPKPGDEVFYGLSQSEQKRYERYRAHTEEHGLRLVYGL